MKELEEINVLHKKPHLTTEEQLTLNNLRNL